MNATTHTMRGDHKSGSANALRKGPLLSVESLEDRHMMSVTSLFMTGYVLVVQADNSATNAEIRQSGANYLVNDLGTGRSWTVGASGVGSVEFRGGNANDRFIDNVMNLPLRAFGYGGNDFLEGYNGADYFDGGLGDDMLRGYGGNDLMFGGSGNDVLLGMLGDDQLVGGDGNDRLNGGDGLDKLWGQNGNDILIAIDNAITDMVLGEAGNDSLWVDLNGSYADAIYGLTTADKVHYVGGFANGTDRTLNGDRIADPLISAGQMYKQFAGQPLFASAGPAPSEIKQGIEGDCWLLAGLSAIALDSPNALRSNVVDFDDGTYGIRLGNKFYRVDNDLPVTAATSTTPVYAKLGNENAMWIAIVEKAFAHYRTGQNNYASLNGGWSIEVNRAFGTATPGDRDLQSFASATALANEIFNQWNNYQSVTIGLLGVKLAGTSPSPLVMMHMYTVMSVSRNAAGVVTSITLRNPWGVDGGGNIDGNPNDGLVTVTPQQLFRYTGRLNWGRV